MPTTSKLTAFPLFPRLPKEIQTHIWTTALNAEPPIVEVEITGGSDRNFVPVGPTASILSVCGPLRSLPGLKPIYLPSFPPKNYAHNKSTGIFKAKAVKPIYLRPSKDVLHIQFLDFDIPAFLGRPENHEIRHLGIDVASLELLVDVFSGIKTPPAWPLLTDLNLQTLHVFDRMTVPQDERLYDRMPVLVGHADELSIYGPKQLVWISVYIEEVEKSFIEVLPHFKEQGLVGREWVPPKFVGTEWKEK